MSWNQRRFLQALHNPRVRYVVHAGARNNGKSKGNVDGAVICACEYPGARFLMLRTITSSAEANLGDEIPKSAQAIGLPPGYIRRRDLTYVFRNGSTIDLSYLRQNQDWQPKKGIQWHKIFFEEATQYPEFLFDRVCGSCRGDGRVDIPIQVVMTTNPDGIGHPYIYRRFINPETREKDVELIECAIRDCWPAINADPGYVLRVIRRLPPTLQAAWEHGDWTVVEGQFWNLPKEMVQDVAIPPWARLYAGVDYGFWPGAFAVVYGARWRDDNGQDRLHVFEEAKVHRTTYTELARLMRDKEEAIAKKYNLTARVRFADPSCWRKQGETKDGQGIVVAHAWAENGIVIHPSISNQRVGGWDVIRDMAHEGVLTISPSCKVLLQEMQDAMIEANGSDMDDRCEDHLQDALRYLCVSAFFGRPTQSADAAKRAALARRAAKLRGGEYIRVGKKDVFIPKEDREGFE